MNPDRAQSIWAALDRLRDRVPLQDLVGVLEALSQEGFTVGPADVEMLLQRTPGFGGVYFPTHLARFIADLLAPLAPQSILDPWANVGILAVTVARELEPTVFDAVTPNAEAHDVLLRLAQGVSLSASVGEPLETLSKGHRSYDAVVSCPPFNVKTDQTVEVVHKGESREVKDEYGHLLVLSACQHLEEAGTGVFVLPPSFLLSPRPSHVRVALLDLGFRIRASIELPSGVLHPLTSMPANLVVLDRGTQGPIFTAEYSQDPDHQRTVLSNLRSGREGARVAQGALVQFDEFQGFTVLAASEHVQQLAERMELEEVSFGSIVAEVNLTRTGRGFSRLQERPNSVYLPLMAATPASTSQDRLPEKLKSYVQLVIRQDVAEAGFVAGLLNTPLGMAIRDAARRGSTIPRISCQDLLHGPFFQLPLEAQTAVASAQVAIDRQRRELSELESGLWASPSRAGDIEAGLAEMSEQERFEAWVDVLPFPLASVLWRYHTFKGPSREAYERLLAFFEVVAEFCAIVQLSAFSSIDAIWSSIRPELASALEKQSLSMDRPTFGTWKCCVEFLSKKAREAEMRQLRPEMFRTSYGGILDAITSKRLVGILQDTNAIRNNAKGHPGAVGERYARQVADKLREHLGRTRDIFSRAWQDYVLLLPQECRYQGGVFEYSAQSVVGTRVPFKTISLTLTEAMEDGSLHLWSPGENRALRLLPMIKMMPSPEIQQNACYFYNRRQANGIRFLSYYFERDPDVTGPFQDTAQALGMLFPTNGGSDLR